MGYWFLGAVAIVDEDILNAEVFHIWSQALQLQSRPTNMGDMLHPDMIKRGAEARRICEQFVQNVDSHGVELNHETFPTKQKRQRDVAAVSGKIPASS